MKFNPFLWKTYRESQSCRDITYTFRNILKKSAAKEIKEILNSFHLAKYSDEEISYLIQNIQEIEKILFEDEKAGNLNITNENDAYNLYNEFCYDENSESVWAMDYIDSLTTVLHLRYPDYFFPYFFERQFFDIQNIFSEFGIFLPQVPPKRKMEERQKYYLELCKSMTEFRTKYDISAIEIPAFLYGFAVNVIPKYTIENELPEPQKAFFVGGGINNNGDFESLDKAGKQTVYNWNGNPESRPGDIIVMYCLSPRSYIHSIWRVVAPGSIDPFFYFYSNIYIGHPIHVEHIQLQEIKNDNILKEMPLVRGNMQGINGRLIEKKYYDRILELLKGKSQDILNLPTLNDIEIPKEKIQNERDVELQLLEPLLNKLGFEEKNWKRQFAVKMGRNDKIIPDYAIYPKLEKGNESCFWIWEAKYAVNSHKQLEKDFYQAKSYALRLRSKGLGVVSKEGIWLSKQDFDFKKIQFWNWTQLKERDIFNEIQDYIGGNSKWK